MSLSDAVDLLQQSNPELWVVTTGDGACRGGLLASSVHSVSIVRQLPRVLIGLGKQHHTTNLVLSRGRCLLHLITADQTDLAWRFGLQSGHQTDKWLDVAWEWTAEGLPRLSDVSDWIECRVEARFDIGDRWLFVGEVLDANASTSRIPLRIQQFLDSASQQQRELLANKMQADAAEDAVSIATWRQTVSQENRSQQGESPECGSH